MTNQKYIPALSLKWLTPFYDWLVDQPMSGLRMRKDMLAQMGDLNSKRILDVGCGTGTLAAMVKQMYPDAEVVGLDGDSQILEIARSKAKSLGVDIRFEQGMSFDLPYPDASFDVVLTSFMLHHLEKDAKQKTAKEMYRVLRPDGRLIGMDFTEPRNIFGKTVMSLARPFERIADNLDGFLPVMFHEAGFKNYQETRYYLSGTISLFQSSAN
ncbi:MAG: class I SAM-dependent methyltransferase [Chloroflexi bacterium]|nr:class I SAM-dependent methyltransferase [Chloroflexota bacterium]